MVTSLLVFGSSSGAILQGQASQGAYEKDMERLFIGKFNQSMPLEDIGIRFTHFIWKYTFNLTNGILSLDLNKTFANCTLNNQSKNRRLLCTFDLSKSAAAYNISKKNSMRLRKQYFNITANITVGTLNVSISENQNTNGESVSCTADVKTLQLQIKPQHVSILPKVREIFKNYAETNISTKIKSGLENTCRSAAKELQEEWRKRLQTPTTHMTDIPTRDAASTTASSTKKGQSSKDATTTTTAATTKGEGWSEATTASIKTTQEDSNNAMTISSTDKTSTVSSSTPQAGEMNTSNITAKTSDSADEVTPPGEIEHC